MNIIGVSVEVKKMLSDGDYGHESAQVSYTAEIDDGEDAEGATVVLLARARAQCVVQLQSSESITVRRKINAKRRVCNGCGLELDDEIRGYLHPACDERLRAEQLAARATRDAEHVPDLEEMPF